MKAKQLKISIAVEGDRGHGKSYTIDLLRNTLLQNGFILIEDENSTDNYKYTERYEGSFINNGWRRNVTS